MKNKIQEEGACRKVRVTDFLKLLFICTFLFKIHWNTIFGEMKAKVKAALRREEKMQSVVPQIFFTGLDNVQVTLSISP
ncbi:hypothetical protein [Peribacillus asahii]|uniref:hypothetical protein n=1 Tax=Peribacillus asahii TaxID=228899 RepID=UPI00207AA1A1|nr:hypothetical protein [Peribacillus asahii]USK59635.1 hypothetical protein LIT37_21245 [Peribacillus asahii]